MFTHSHFVFFKVYFLNYLPSLPLFQIFKKSLKEKRQIPVSLLQGLFFWLNNFPQVCVFDPSETSAAVLASALTDAYYLQPQLISYLPLPEKK